MGTAHLCKRTRARAHAAVVEMQTFANRERERERAQACMHALVKRGARTARDRISSGVDIYTQTHTHMQAHIAYTALLLLTSVLDVVVVVAGRRCFIFSACVFCVCYSMLLPLHAPHVCASCVTVYARFICGDPFGHGGSFSTNARMHALHACVHPSYSTSTATTQNTQSPYSV